jgi:hypothetical protein
MEETWEEYFVNIFICKKTLQYHECTAEKCNYKTSLQRYDVCLLTNKIYPKLVNCISNEDRDETTEFLTKVIKNTKQKDPLKLNEDNDKKRIFRNLFSIIFKSHLICFDSNEIEHWVHQSMLLYEIIDRKINLESFFIAFVNYLSTGLIVRSNQHVSIPKNLKISRYFPKIEVVLKLISHKPKDFTFVVKYLKENANKFTIEDFLTN